MSSQSESMDYVLKCLEDDEPINFVTYLKRQDIENRFIFNRFFKKKLLEKMVREKNKEDSRENLTDWAQEIIDNEFEILDRVEVIEYWNKVEERKFKANLKYQTTVQLNKRAEYESKITSDMFKEDDNERALIKTKIHKRQKVQKD